MPKLLVIGDHFISPELMRTKIEQTLRGLSNASTAIKAYSSFPLHPSTIIEASTPFPLEPFRDIAEVREASGSEKQMIDLLGGVSIAVVHHAPLTARIFEHAPELKLLIVCRGGPVNVNLPAATAHGVTVAYTPARNAVATAEHTIALMLSALRGIPQADAAIRRGEWKGDYTYASAGFELETAVAGLIGYGAIGRMVARILRGFGTRVLVYDPFARIDVGIDAADAVEQVGLDELLERSNIVSLHARETPESRGILGAAEFARLPQGAVVVNCARGSLMDYGALAQALRSGHLFAAAADVFPTEPLPADSSLPELPNFVMTPHIAGGTRGAAEKAATIAAEELALYLEGKPLRYCANPEVGFS